MPDKPLLSKDGSVHITDEFYNTLISSVGAVLSVIGVILLMKQSWASGRPGSVLAFSIYGFGLVNMFLWSALHHGVDGSPRTNHWLRQMDYFAISVMIAGTFTPFCVILLRNSMGWTVLGVVWALAAATILIKAAYPEAPRWLLTSLYIGMGWLGLAIVSPIYRHNPTGLGVVVLGGLFFTVGGVIYGSEKPNPFPGRFGFHEIWHLLVLAGAASHFFVMYVYL